MKRFVMKGICSLLLVVLVLQAFTPIGEAKQLNSNGLIASPEASIESGTYYKTQLVELQSSTSGVNIYYTTDGTTPSKDSTLYSTPITVNEDTIVKAIAIRGNVDSKALEVSNGKTKSTISTFTYSFTTKQEIASKFLSFTYNDMPYRLYVPENYDPTQSYPLVLFLHGGGERGTDNEKQILANDGAVIWAAPENQAKHPAFVLAPQARNVHDGGFGITRDTNNIISLNRVFQFSQDLGTAYDILQKVRSEYNIDSNRLYSTGLSQGGFGTFNLNIKYPELFAAMVPIAGGGDPALASALVNKPIWAFHAVDDIIIPVSYSQNIIAAIQNAGGNPIYTEYPADLGYNHGSWIPAYENKEMIEWVFKQVKK
jgi:predicted peptidase